MTVVEIRKEVEFGNTGRRTHFQDSEGNTPRTWRYRDIQLTQK